MLGTSGEIDLLYLEAPPAANSVEMALQGDLARRTFGQGGQVTVLRVASPAAVTVGDLLERSTRPVLAVALEPGICFSRSWLPPLVEALAAGVALAAPVCSDLLEVPPYLTPLGFEDAALRMALRHRGRILRTSAFPLFCFATRRSTLAGIDAGTALRDLPGRLDSALVPSSLVHRFCSYYACLNRGLLDLIPPGAAKILDVGCASGLLGELIKRERGAEVHGVEVQPEAAEAARARLDRVHCANVEEADLPYRRELDVVVFADTLEHLVDPWGLLRKAREWLKPDGIVVAAVPNTGHVSIIADLLRGRWDYVPMGLLCVGHLRFFTRATLEETFSRAGYSPVSVTPQSAPVRPDGDLALSLGRLIDLDRLPSDAFVTGFHVLARNAPSPRC